VRYWLFKTEPSVFSWDDLVAKGEAGEEWDGVRNYQARNVMREMAVGDRGFLYHSQSDKALVGTVEVVAESHPDSTSDDARWDCVDIRALEPLPRPVTLAEVKAEPDLAEMALVRQARLSVQPVAPEEWARVMALAEGEPRG
jgi:predicted RNA-binding protein with PUA-like domain